VVQSSVLAVDWRGLCRDQQPGGRVQRSIPGI